MTMVVHFYQAEEAYVKRYAQMRAVFTEVVFG